MWWPTKLETRSCVNARKPTGALRRQISIDVGKLKKLRMGPVTPLILSLSRIESVTQLVSEQAVEFDFDADGRPESRQWLQPTAGLLVWQGEGSTDITSGTQLFGNCSFNMLWRDGFAPLRALDDNGDGWLRGDELRGMAVWFDRDSNGQSSSDEIVGLETSGIVGLATQPTGMDDDTLVHDAGVEFSNGEHLPLWDWLAQPASTHVN